MESGIASGGRPGTFTDRVRTFVRSGGLDHEIAVISVSYLFVFSGAWNDGLIGLAPSTIARVAETAMALVLIVEVVARLRFVARRGAGFWLLIGCDIFSLLTIFPFFVFLSFGRLARMGYASVRVISIVDRLAVRDGNALYFLVLYPLVVPLAAAMLFAFEHGVPHGPVQNYVQALAACFTFALSLGTVKPATVGGTTVCGALFIFGVMCIGILTNFISNRYAGSRGGGRS